MRIALAIACVLVTSPAAAWYFPEHVVVTKDALTGLAPEIRDVLAVAVERARQEGLPLCANVAVGLEDVPRSRPLSTRMIRAEGGADCVPYAALSALGGDHADDATELRAVLASRKGIELTTAAAYGWQRFQRAVDRLPNAPIERMSFVHELDVGFYFIDPGYELRAQASRSHFVDAGPPLPDVVRAAALEGRVDNATAQFLLHHLRALQLAARGRLGEALLEHGLSLHFLQDSFSSGHLVMKERLWRNGNTWVRRRHDYFDARGLAVRRATGIEPCAALEQSFEAGVPPCWMTTGDGHLGLTKDGSDRVHTARAVRKAQLQLAFALDPGRVVAFVESLGEGEQIALAELLDPAPWWTLPPARRRRRSASAQHARELVRGAARAVEHLREGPLTPSIGIGARVRGPLLEAEVVAGALDPCAASPHDARDDGDGDAGGCGHDRDLALGTIGTSFLRPMLVELPAAEAADVGELSGQALTDHGMAFQLTASTAAGALFARHTPVDFFAPALGVSMGLAYRLGTYLPGRRDRPGVEVNVGISAALHYDSHGRAGGNATVTMLEQDLRWPILWEALTSYALPYDLRKSQDAGRIILFGGVRAREMLTDPSPRFWGVELEVAAVALSSGSGAYPLYTASPEVRAYVGVADPSVAQPSFPTTWAPTLNLMFTGGYATFL